MEVVVVVFMGITATAGITGVGLILRLTERVTRLETLMESIHNNRFTRGK